MKQFEKSGSRLDLAPGSGLQALDPKVTMVLEFAF